MRIAIIGAGAAGCICAVEVKRLHPEADVTVYEAGREPLAKVALTGGGRCNITNTFAGVDSLRDVYPRGWRLMHRLLHGFGPQDTVRWFAAEGVRLKEEDGGRLFPVTDDARTVVRALKGAMRHCGVQVLTGKALVRLTPAEDQWRLSFKDGVADTADTVILCTGGFKKAQMLQDLNIEIILPVPSLFTFNIPDPGLRTLMGTSVQGVSVKLAGTKFSASGDILVTHWGFSGPAVLRLSSYAARELADRSYKADICVRWWPDANVSDVPASATGQVGDDPAAWIRDNIALHPARLCSSVRPEGIPARLWEFLLGRSGLRSDLRWGELGSRGAARLTSILTADTYHIDGQTRFREEFVTCGGVALSSIHADTLESRQHSGLYFAGEILDIDAITGGFNLQAAWTTGITVARSLNI